MILINNYDRKQLLINTFRKLWEQHIMWTRSFIISTASQLADLDLVTKRLLRNPNDMANVLSQFYGKQKAEEFKQLFTAHLTIAADLVNAAKKGDTQEIKMYEKKWYQNADDIAKFLSSINPHWSKNEWQKLLYDHLKMTEAEAVNRLSGKYEEDIKLYDSIEDEALKMADYMAKGIIKQFNY